MKTNIITLMMCLSVVFAGERKSGETTYKLNFDKKMADCDDFTNDVVDATGLEVKQDSASSTALEGGLTVKQEINEGTKITMTVYKVTDVGNEFFYEIDADMCEHIGDKDAPWTPLFEAMGVSACPVEAKEYPIDKLQLNLDYADGLMNHEFTGDYYATLSFTNSGDDLDVEPKKVSCHGIFTSIIEYKEEK